MGPYLAYLGGLFLYGSNGIVASGISMPSSQLVLARTSLGCLFLLAICLLKRTSFASLKNARDAAFVIVSGISMGAAWLFLYQAYAEIGVGVTTLIFYCGPVIVMALAPALFKTRLTVPMVLGFGIVLMGMVLVNVQSLSEGKTAFGLGCAGMSAVMYAMMIVFNKKAASIKGLENATLQLFATLVATGVFVGLTQGFEIEVRPHDWPALLVLGLANTGLATLLYFHAVDALPVQTISVCGYLEPLFAVGLSAVVLGETLQTLQIVGGCLIIGGALVSELSQRRE